MRRSVAVVACVVSVGLAVATALLSQPSWRTLSAALVGVTFVAVGTFIAVRASGNPVGLLMVAYGLLVQAGSFFETYIEAGLPDAVWVAWTSNFGWYPQVAVLAVLLPLYFPDGVLPGPRWRWVLVAVVVGWIGFGLGNAFTEDAVEDYGFANPSSIDLPGAVETSLQLAGFLGMASSVVGGVAAAVLRFRRSSGSERQQMKWFAFAAVVLVASLATSNVLYETGYRKVAPLILLPASLVMAGSVAIAVLKYRLYDIDRVVSRSLVYAVVVSVLGGVFAIGVVALPNLAYGSESPPPWVVAGTTLVIAAFFNPLRRRVRTVVDRRFNRSRYDAQVIADDFAGSLRDQTDSDLVLEGWVGVVSETMQPASLGVWVRS